MKKILSLLLVLVLALGIVFPVSALDSTYTIENLSDYLSTSSADGSSKTYIISDGYYCKSGLNYYSTYIDNVTYDYSVYNDSLSETDGAFYVGDIVSNCLSFSATGNLVLSASGTTSYIITPKFYVSYLDSSGVYISYQQFNGTFSKYTGSQNLTLGGELTIPEGTEYMRFSFQIGSLSGMTISSIEFNLSVSATFTPIDLPEVPVFTENLSGSYSYEVGDYAVPLYVTAVSPDGGTLSYQWYRHTSPVYPGCTAISGATSIIYTPGTSAASTYYYFCKVTNTLNGQSSSVYSDFVCVTVTDPPDPLECDGSLHAPMDSDVDYICDVCFLDISPSLRYGYYYYNSYWFYKFTDFHYDETTYYPYAYLMYENDIFTMYLLYDKLIVDEDTGILSYTADGSYIYFEYNGRDAWTYKGAETYAKDTTFNNDFNNLIWSNTNLVSNTGVIWLIGDSTFAPDSGGSSGDSGSSGDIVVEPSFDDQEKNSLWSWLRGINNAIDLLYTPIQEIPLKVLEGIKELFVPDYDEMLQRFKDLYVEMAESVYGSEYVDQLFGDLGSVQGVQPGNVTSDITIVGVQFENLTFADFSILASGVSYFRPVINGFLVFLLSLFWFREFLSFIGQTPSMAGPSNKSSSSDSSGQKK